MSSLQSAVYAEPKSEPEYDQEIVDMAKYIHHYDIKSDLAVSLAEQRVLSAAKHIQSTENIKN